MTASTSCLEIDLTRLDANVRAWRGALQPPCDLCAVVKADGYGIGAAPLTRRLIGAGVRCVAVYSLAQATELARAGLSVDTLVLMPVDDIDRTDILYRKIIAGTIHLAVHSAAQLEAVEQLGMKFGTPIPIHLELDTGMSRLGMPMDEADAILTTLSRRRYLKLRGVFSHAASADTDAAATRAQLQRYEALLAKHPALLSDRDVTLHFAGTAAALRGAAYHQSMVRIGLGLLGYGVDGLRGEERLPDPPALRPIVRWTAKVVHTLDLPAGRSVGYHGRFTTTEPSRIAVVPVGYADGLPLSLSDRAVVRVGPHLDLAPVRGEINMDQIAIDITGLGHVGVGSEVELYANDDEAPNALPRMAEAAGSSCYELLCRISPRVQRRYVVTDHHTGRIGHVATRGGVETSLAV